MEHPTSGKEAAMPRQPVRLQGPSGLWPPTWPMGLTMLRLLLLPVFLWTLVLSSDLDSDLPYRYFAVGIFAIMAITDKLDGYLARKLQQATKLGAILDPLADKLLIACSVVLLSLGRVATPEFRIPIAVVIAVYGKDLITVLGTLAVMALVGHVQIIARPLGKLSTVVQLALVMATLLGPDLTQLGVAGWLLPGLWWGVSALAILACSDYVVQGARQYHQSRVADAAHQTDAAAP
jgi:CDP-diacylglycerol--glycerol-3-phosphate 3-phosphatidyltransferase